MNAVHDLGEEVVVIGTTTAFAGKADLCGVVFEDIQRHMTHNSHILCRMVFPDPAVILSEGHIQAPMQRIFNKGNWVSKGKVYLPLRYPSIKVEA